VIEVLLAHRADISAKDKDGSTALHWAADRGDKEVIEALLAGSVDVNEKNKNGSTALHWGTMILATYLPAG
jgi:ankyrin repeat protein